MIQREMYYMDTIRENITVPFPIASPFLYYIEIKVILSKELINNDFHLEGNLEILDHTSKNIDNLMIKHKKFFNTCYFDFKYNNPESRIPGFTFSTINLSFPKVEKTYFFSITIDSILLSQIEKLNTSKANKDAFLIAIEKHFNKDYMGCIHELGNLAESIAKTLYTMLNKPWNSFRSAVQSLITMNPQNTQYNFKFLGSQLAPLYALRNEIDHPNTKLKIYSALTESAIHNLSLILNYFIENKINF
ncbi:MAG: hypothetical protein ACFFG0_16375 [Candidatus Thorarchaeota archaeon]